MAYPLLRSFILSLYKFATPRTSRFVGWRNYAFILHDKAFWLIAANTALLHPLFPAAADRRSRSAWPCC